MSSSQENEVVWSVVIPAYNEEAVLGRLLDTLDRARNEYVGGKERVEVIVVDNMSTDQTAEIAKARGCRVVREEKRIIAAVRNSGARQARGRYLTFIDADTRVVPQTFNAIENALTDKVVAGATGVQLERWSLGIFLTYLWFLVMIWTTKMDNGVVFCRRKDFEELGGYDEKLTFAEDVKFLWDMRTLGKSRGQGLRRVRSAKALADMRKFDKHGDWHYFTMFFRFLFSLIGVGDLQKMAEKYWYKPDR